MNICEKDLNARLFDVFSQEREIIVVDVALSSLYTAVRSTKGAIMFHNIHH